MFQAIFRGELLVSGSVPSIFRGQKKPSSIYNFLLLGLLEGTHLFKILLDWFANRYRDNGSNGFTVCNPSMEDPMLGSKNSKKPQNPMQNHKSKFLVVVSSIAYVYVFFTSTWGNDPILTRIFFNWVGFQPATTNDFTETLDLGSQKVVTLCWIRGVLSRNEK